MGMQLRSSYSRIHQNGSMIIPPATSSTSLHSFAPAISLLFKNHSIQTKDVVLESSLNCSIGGPRRRRRRREYGVLASSSSNVAAPFWDGWQPQKGPAAPSLSDIVWPSAGAFAAMAILGKMDQILAPRGISMTIAPLGAVSAVLFAAPSSPAARIVQYLSSSNKSCNLNALPIIAMFAMTDSSNKKLQGKVAIITGGASGIGEATAHLFAEHGARMVVIADIQDQLGHQVATSIGIDKCQYVHCDVSDEDQVKNMVETTVQKHGQLDIMFSNAGTASSSDQTILELDLSGLDKVIETNARGMALCVKHAARVMVERRVRGSIVCTGSVAASQGKTLFTDYCMSKHAVLGLVRAASVQLGQHGIRVNCVSPALLATPMSCDALGMDAEQVEKISEPNSSLKGVVLKVRDVANAVLFLASDDSGFVTGLDLKVDGGPLRK